VQFWSLVRVECSAYSCEGLGKHAHFRNFGMAFLTLFRVATGDNWNGIMKVSSSLTSFRLASLLYYNAARFFIFFIFRNAKLVTWVWTSKTQTVFRLLLLPTGSAEVSSSNYRTSEIEDLYSAQRYRHRGYNKSHNEVQVWRPSWMLENTWSANVSVIVEPQLPF